MEIHKTHKEYGGTKKYSGNFMAHEIDKFSLISLDQIFSNKPRPSWFLKPFFFLARFLKPFLQDLCNVGY
jgi:hypothetical protein